MWMRVALIYPNMYGEYFPSIGLTYIATVIEETHDVTIVDLTHLRADWKPVLRQALRQINPQIVGLSTISFNHQLSLEIARLVKREFPDAPVIFGGVHPILRADEVIRSSCVDFVCTGEGEITFPALLEALERGTPVTAVKGLLFKNPAGKVLRTPPQPLIEDLDALPFPNWDHWDMTKYFKFTGVGKILPVLASRGCVFSCSFCSNRALRECLTGKYLRVRSPENVIQEILHQRAKYRARFDKIFFWDENFMGNSPAFYRFCELYRQYGLHTHLIWTCNLRADFVTDRWAEAAHGAGCYLTRIGVDAGNEWVRKTLLNKPISDARIYEARRIMKAHDVMVRFNMILGAPGENIATMRDSYRMIKRTRPEQFFFSIFQPIPGATINALIPIFDGTIFSEQWSQNHDFWKISIVNTRYISRKDIERFKDRINLIYIAKFFLDGLRRRNFRFLRDILHFLRYRYIQHNFLFQKLAIYTVFKYKTEDWRARFLKSLLSSGKGKGKNGKSER